MSDSTRGYLQIHDRGYLQTGILTYRNNLKGECFEEFITEDSSFPKADLIIGGPPCQGFSLANKNRNKVNQDSRNKLFYECKPFAQKLIIEEPFGRHATDLAHQVAMLAEGINPNTGQPDDEYAQPILAPSGQQ